MILIVDEYFSHPFHRRVYLSLKNMERNKRFKIASWVGPKYRINAIFLIHV
jgi:hypothetical protein